MLTVSRARELRDEASRRRGTGGGAPEPGPEENWAAAMPEFLAGVDPQQTTELIALLTQAVSYYEGLTLEARKDVALKFKITEEQVQETFNCLYASEPGEVGRGAAAGDEARGTLSGTVIAMAPVKQEARARPSNPQFVGRELFTRKEVGNGVGGSHYEGCKVWCGPNGKGYLKGQHFAPMTKHWNANGPW